MISRLITVGTRILRLVIIFSSLVIPIFMMLTHFTLIMKHQTMK